MAISPCQFVGVEGATYNVSFYTPTSDTAVATYAGIAAQTNRKSLFVVNVTEALSGIYVVIATAAGDSLIDSTGYVWMSDTTAMHYVALTYDGALEVQRAAQPALPILTASAADLDVVTGDDLAITVDLTDDAGDPIPIDLAATVRASFQYKRERISAIVTCSDGTAGSDWLNGRIIVVFSDSQSGDILLDQQEIRASLEIEVEELTIKTTYFVNNFRIREGLLV